VVCGGKEKKGALDKGNIGKEKLFTQNAAEDLNTSRIKKTEPFFWKSWNFEKGAVKTGGPAPLRQEKY